jgi:CBS domain-containing protein
VAHSTLEAARLEIPHDLVGRSVGDAMLQAPRVLGPEATVSEAAAFFEDEHLHAALVVEPGGRLLSVVVRADLAGRSGTEPLTVVGALHGRTIRGGAQLEQVWLAMRCFGHRRLAVMDGDRLVGLLCLKASGLGFCSDADVAARAQGRPTC